MFNSILIANRGEIACRIIRTAKRLGIRSIAVYSDVDANALHVRMADSAVHIGPASASQSYLNIDTVVEAARATNAEALHPGYGFLSENADFAEACQIAGLVFIGPSAEVIRMMGEKQSALALMHAAGVPTLPSSSSHEADDDALHRAAQRIGFPVMVKPNAGGGGKGMHVVHDSKQLSATLLTARREADNAFASRHLMIEKFLPEARHVEVQIFADTFGKVVHLFERDCSIQRRHQKVLEESPAPKITDEFRESICQAAVTAASTVDYLGAGTVEFLVSGGHYYFLEMNTRLQVEHPVTELTTGLDLVELQLKVAAGEPLGFEQTEVKQKGHAIEARVYAEDVRAGFLPSAGRIDTLNLPAQTTNLRLDCGVQSGDEVSVHYDPMLLKVISVAPDRASAITALRAALLELELTGVNTNLWLLGSLLSEANYRRGALSTELLSKHVKQHADAQPRTDHDLLVVSVTFMVASRRSGQRGTEHTTSTPWSSATPWRLNATAKEVVTVTCGSVKRDIEVIHIDDYYLLGDGKHQTRVDVDSLTISSISARLDGHRIEARISYHRNNWVARSSFAELSFSVERDSAATRLAGDESGRLTAPLPGTVLKVMVHEGVEVEKNTALMVIEAMKMEHTIRAPKSGIIAKVMFSPGDRVDEDAELIVIR